MIRYILSLHYDQFASYITIASIEAHYKYFLLFKTLPEYLSLVLTFQKVHERIAGVMVWSDEGET